MRKYEHLERLPIARSEPELLGDEIPKKKRQEGINKNVK
jgi:hypothetical protein